MLFQNIFFNNNLLENSNQSNFTNSLNQVQKNNINNKTTQNNNTTKNQVKQNNSTKVTNQNNIKSNSNNTNSITKTAHLEQSTWKIVIPSIELEAMIDEGTSAQVMNKYVGHFENTSKWNGNVALAAHNRGYPVNYFANLKTVKEGEIVEYYWNGEKRVYKVETITKINDTDWTYLANTTDNRITLITCVENEPEYRRCVQAIEI